MVTGSTFAWQIQSVMVNVEKPGNANIFRSYFKMEKRGEVKLKKQPNTIIYM